MMATYESLPEVTKFVVKVPLQFSTNHAGIRECLNASFPSRAFAFEGARDSADGISLIPVMEDAQGRAHLCRNPDRSLVSRIYEVLNDYIFGLEIRSV